MTGSGRRTGCHNRSGVSAVINYTAADFPECLGRNPYADAHKPDDSPSIAFIRTFPEYIGQVRTVPGVLQSRNHIISGIVLNGDYYVGQHLDEENRRVIRLSRTMLDGEAHRICHRGYHTCVECGSGITLEPDDIWGDPSPARSQAAET